jgi:two-component system, NtrC family, sensor histidine kinase HydH
MFHVSSPHLSKGLKFAIALLALLELTSLAVTVWIFKDFGHEQELITRVMSNLPAADLVQAKELASELRIQSRMTLLLFVNVLATGAALALLLRALVSSEKSLRDVKVLATDILASMDLGVITTDRFGVITSINPTGMKLAADNCEIGSSLSALHPRHATIVEACNQVLQEHSRVRDRDYTFEWNGHTRHYRISCTLLRDARKQELGTVMQLRDVTKRTLVEQRLRRMERYMGLGSLASGLQHEIKNPLSALSLHLQLLEEHIEKLPHASELDDHLAVLRTEVSRITNVLEKFRNYASMNELGMTETNIEPLIDNVVRLIRPQLCQNNIRLELDISANNEQRVVLDRTRIEQVLLNLALNAIEAMKSGGTLTIKSAFVDDNFCLEVSDTGMGIPADIQNQIFDPYFTTKHEGTGLGLAISEKIVRQHNGTIDFSSSQTGTVFKISIPLDNAA